MKLYIWNMLLSFVAIWSAHGNHRIPMRCLLLVALVLVGGVMPATADTITFSDGTFVDASWTAQEILDTSAGSANSFGAFQVMTGGNPDKYRRTEHQLIGGSFKVAHLSSFIYAPSTQGGIVTIDYAFDLTDFGGTGSVAYDLILRQDGTFYDGPGTLSANSPGWVANGDVGLTENEFALVIGTGTLDFSASGAPITFGYMTANSATVGQRTSGIDNFSVTLSTSSVIPEPGTFALLGFGLVALVSLAWRRHRWPNSYSFF